MAITFISHFRVKPGRTDDLRVMAAMVSSQLEGAKPSTAAFLPYLDEAGARFAIVHVFPDADAMRDHFAGAEQRSAAGYELFEPAGWEIYGQPHPSELASMRSQATKEGVELVVHSEALAGFLRASRA